MATKIGHGILTWDGTERRSNRYGSIHLCKTNLNEDAAASLDVDFGLLSQFEDKKVRLTCKVVETRESGHIGDMFLKIMPSRPEVGESIDLGVGIFTSTVGFDGGPDLVLKPGDGRNELWIDPRKLYRVHDQTVDVFIEETTDDFTPPPDLTSDVSEGAIDNGNGFFQVKTKEKDPQHVLPEVTRLGEGMFTLSPIGSAPEGTVHKLEKIR